MDWLFALKILAGVGGFVVGIVLGSLIAAIWLRLAAQWLRFATVPYLTAFKCALISNLVVFTFNFSIGFSYGLMTVLISQLPPELRFRYVDFSSPISPIYFFCTTVFGILVTAAIFGRTISSKDSDTRITFSDSLALASLYFALSFGFALIFGLLAFCAVAVRLS